MNNKMKEVAIILAFFHSFEKMHLPRIVGIKLKLVHGNAVDEYELVYLTEALEHITMLLPYLDRYPAYKPVVAKVMNYYRLVVDEVIANEKLATINYN